MKKASIILVLIVFLLAIVGCTSDVSTAPSEKQNSNIIKEDKSLIEVFDVKLTPICEGQGNLLKISYLIKTEQINNKIIFAVADNDGNKMIEKEVNTMSGDNTFTANLNLDGNGEKDVIISAFFREKEVYKAKHKLNIPKLDFEVEFSEPKKYYMSKGDDGHWNFKKYPINDSSYKVALEIVPKNNCRVPLSLAKIEVYNSNNGIIGEYSNNYTLYQRRIDCNEMKGAFGDDRYCYIYTGDIEVTLIPYNLSSNYFLYENEDRGYYLPDVINEVIYGKEPFVTLKGFVSNDIYGERKATKKISFN